MEGEPLGLNSYGLEFLEHELSTWRSRLRNDEHWAKEAMATYLSAQESINRAQSIITALERSIATLRRDREDDPTV